VERTPFISVLPSTTRDTLHRRTTQTRWPEKWYGLQKYRGIRSLCCAFQNPDAKMKKIFI